MEATTTKRFNKNSNPKLLKVTPGGSVDIVERCVKTIQEITHYQQHCTNVVRAIVESELYYSDILTQEKILNRKVIEIICKLRTIGLVSDVVVGYLYHELLECVGVYLDV